MDDKSKPINEEEQKSENNKQETVEEKTDEIKEEKTKELKKEEKQTGEKPKIEKEKTEDIKEEKPMEEKDKSEKTNQEATDDKKPKEETKKTDTVKDKKKKDDDFKYIVRIANTDIDGNKKVVHGLTSIKGVGMHIASLIIDKTSINKKSKIGDLSDKDIDKIRKTLDEITEIAPSWMLNHRKDYETGEDIHIIGSDIELRLRDEINIMKKIRCYRGIRHERGLTVRGQRTRANNRKGLSLGVSKRRETK